MHICKYHSVGTLVDTLGKTTIRPNEHVAIVKKTDRVIIAYIKRKGRAIKVTVGIDSVNNFVKL